MRIAVDQAALAGAADPGHREYPGQNGADGTTNAVHAEGVEAVVITQDML